jgi:hypothetical protein
VPRFDLKRLLANRHNPNLLLTPLVDKFFLTNDQDKYIDEEIDLAVELMKKWREARSIEHHSPSSANACLRQQMLTHWGYKGEQVDDPYLASILSDGNWRHLRWHMIFKRMDRAGLLKMVAVEKRIVYHPWFLGGTPDDVLDVPTKDGLVRIVVDIKGTNSDKFKWIQQNNRPIDGHEWQLHAYMVGLRLGRGVLWYESKNDQGYCEIPVFRDREIVRELIRRYRVLRQARQTGILPVHGCSMQSDGSVDPKDLMFRRCRQRLNCLALTKQGY